MKVYIMIVDKDKITIQRSNYIEDGPYIEITGKEITLFEIPQYGGVAQRLGNFSTLLKAIEHSETLT